MKKYYIFAGVNGAGKTTLHELIRRKNEELKNSVRINSDEIVLNNPPKMVHRSTKVIHENNDTYSQKQIESVKRDLENVRLEYERLCEVMMNKLYGLE